jgi:chromosome-anchoring protein RacA
MVYKTNDVVDKLGTNSKVVLKYAKQHNIQKNALGHYIFSEGDVDAIKEYISTPQKNSPLASIPPELIQSLQNQLHSLTKRADENERKLYQKADEGVSYQLLHHRKEIEELRTIMTKMNTRLQDLEEYMTKQQEIHKLNETKKPKRRGILMSILGVYKG